MFSSFQSFLDGPVDVDDFYNLNESQFSQGEENRRFKRGQQNQDFPPQTVSTLYKIDEGNIDSNGAEDISYNIEMLSLRNNIPTDQINSQNDSRAYDQSFANNFAGRSFGSNPSGQNEEYQTFIQNMPRQNQRDKIGNASPFRGGGGQNHLNFSQSYDDAHQAPQSLNTTSISLQRGAQDKSPSKGRKDNSRSPRIISRTDAYQIRHGHQNSETLAQSKLSQLNQNSDFKNLSAFDRLYFSGLQRMASRERKSKQQQVENEQILLQELQKQPKISMISNEVAKAIRGREKDRSKSRQAQRGTKLESNSRQQSERSLDGQNRRSQVRFENGGTQSYQDYNDQEYIRSCRDDAQREKSVERNKSSKINDFLEYNKEWKRLRDAKILQAKVIQETKLMEESKPVHQVNQRMIPEDYKGVVSGYYDQVNKFFEKKRLYLELGSSKPEGKPQINDYNPSQFGKPVLGPSRSQVNNRNQNRSRSRSNNRGAQSNQNLAQTQQSNMLINNYMEFTEGTSVDETSQQNQTQLNNGDLSASRYEKYVVERVEERLLKKGIEYKSNLNNKRHEQIEELIREGPTFQPKLISNYQKYLKTSSQSQDQARQDGTTAKNDQELGNQFYCQAMIFLMKKQEKIIESTKQIYEHSRIPKVNSKSKQMLEGQNRTPVYELPLPTKQSQKPNPNIHPQKRQQSEKLSRQQNQDENSQSESSSQNDLEVIARKKEKVNEFIRRNYERELKTKQLRAEQIKNEQSSIGKLLEEGITFQPKLSSGTRNLITARQPRQAPTFEELYREANIKRQRHQQEIEKRKKEKESLEKQEATFKPNVKLSKGEKEIKKTQITVLEQQTSGSNTYYGQNICNKDQIAGQKYSKIVNQREYVKDKLIQEKKKKNGGSYLQMYYQNQYNSPAGAAISHNSIKQGSQAKSNQYVTFNNQQELHLEQINQPALTHINPQIQVIMSEHEPRRSSELNKTMESNLLDFNEDRLMEDTRTLGNSENNQNFLIHHSNRSSLSNDAPMVQAVNSANFKSSFSKAGQGARKSNDVIENFLQDMQVAAQTQQFSSTGAFDKLSLGSMPIEKIIEDALRALMEYDEGQEIIDQGTTQEQILIIDSQERVNLIGKEKNHFESNAPRQKTQDNGMKARQSDENSVQQYQKPRHKKQDSLSFADTNSFNSTFNKDFNTSGVNQDFEMQVPNNLSINQHTPIRHAKSPESVMNPHALSSGIPSTQTKNILDQENTNSGKQRKNQAMLESETSTLERAQEPEHHNEASQVQPFNSHTASSQNQAYPNQVAEQNSTEKNKIIDRLEEDFAEEEKQGTSAETPNKRSANEARERAHNTMNKTLSLIEEEDGEDFFTNNDEDRQSNYNSTNYYPRGSIAQNAGNSNNQPRRSANTINSTPNRISLDSGEGQTQNQSRRAMGNTSRQQLNAEIGQATESINMSGSIQQVKHHKFEEDEDTLSQFRQTNINLMSQELEQEIPLRHDGSLHHELKALEGLDEDAYPLDSHYPQGQYLGGNGSDYDRMSDRRSYMSGAGEGGYPLQGQYIKDTFTPSKFEDEPGRFTPKLDNKESQQRQIEDIRNTQVKETNSINASRISEKEKGFSQNQSMSFEKKKRNKEPQIPSIVKDIENFEQEFTRFLELIYN